MTTAGATHIDGLNRFQFGDSAEMATRLAALVVAGVKTATCSAATLGPETEPGQRHVVLDGADNPVAVIETLTYDRLPFAAVTPAMAALEGEGDKSYRFWRDGHEAFFRREGTWSPDMDVWFEVFRVTDILDQDFAHNAPAHVVAEIAEAAAQGYGESL